MSMQSYARGFCKAAQQPIIYDPRFIKQILENQIAREEADAKKSRSGANPRKHNAAEIVAPLLHALAAGGLGGAIGYKAGKGTDFGGGFGAYAGAVGGTMAGALANGIGIVAAHIAKRRSKQEQIEADRKSTIAKWLIPGVAAYNKAKREERALLENNGQEKKANVQGMAKQAFSLADVKNMLSNANNWYKSQSPEMRALIGAGVGLGGGALLGASRKSALLGALAGAGTGAYWKDIGKAIKAVKPVAQDAKEKTNAYFQNLWNKYVASNDLDAKKPQVTATAKAQTAAGV